MTQQHWVFVGGYGTNIETFAFEPASGALTSGSGMALEFAGLENSSALVLMVLRAIGEMAFTRMPGTSSFSSVQV